MILEEKKNLYSDWLVSLMRTPSCSVQKNNFFQSLLEEVVRERDQSKLKAGRSSYNYMPIIRPFLGSRIQCHLALESNTHAQSCEVCCASESSTKQRCDCRRSCKMWHNNFQPWSFSSISESWNCLSANATKDTCNGYSVTGKSLRHMTSNHRLMSGLAGIASHCQSLEMFMSPLMTGWLAMCDPLILYDFIKSSSHPKQNYPHRNGMPACAMYFGRGDEAAHVDPHSCDPGGWPSFPWSFQCLGCVGAIEPRLSIKVPQDAKGEGIFWDVWW